MYHGCNRIIVLGAALLALSWIGGSAGALASGHVRASVTLLRLPNSAFSPAQVTRSGVEDNAHADQTIFNLRHSTSYVTFGRLTGYDQGAVWQPTTPQMKVSFSYRGSVFSSANGALRAWRDGSTYSLRFKSWVSTNCPTVALTLCARLIGTFRSGYRDWYDIFPYGQCLVETTAFFPGRLSSVYQRQVAITLTNIDRAALAAAERGCRTITPTPAIPTDFSVSIRVENGKHDAVQRVKAGTKVTLVLYVDVRSAAPGSTIVYTFRVKRQGATLLDKSKTDTVTASADALRYRLHFTLKQSGSYKVVGRATINGVGQHDSTSLTVLSSSVSFRFDQLQTLNAGNKPQQTFGAKDTIVIQLTYTVQLVGSTTTGTITRTFQYWDDKQRRWITIGHPISESTNTITNGTHFTRYTYVPLSLGHRQRIVVDLTIGGQKQEKKVVIQIKR